MNIPAKMILLLLSLFMPLSLAVPSTRLSRENCRGLLLPPCVCSENVINCTNAGFTNTDTLANMGDSDWGYLDTIVLTGNNFSELTNIANGHLFGEGVKHKHLTELDLSSNNITELLPETFTGITNLEKLVLRDNRIRLQNYSGKLLKNLPRLQELDLTQALNLVTGQQIQFWHKTFQLSELHSLTKLILADNNIDQIPADFFCSFPQLEEVDLSGNRLREFVAEKRCMQTIVRLDLADNDLDYVTSNFTYTIDEAAQFLKVNLSGNPWECECHLNDFIRWFKGSRRVVSKEQARCLDAYPARLENVPLLDIKLAELECRKDGQKHTHGVYIVIGLILVGLVAFLSCIVWANRAWICQSAKQLTMSNFGGYAKLGPDGEVRAEFV